MSGFPMARMATLVPQITRTAAPPSSSVTVPDRRRRSRWPLLAIVAAAFAWGGCHGKDAKAVAIVESELALLKPPAGISPTDQRVGLGEMYAEGAQTYCFSDEKTGQRALDSMLREAGWQSVSTSTNAEATVWHYQKGGHLGSLSLETQPQPCGRRFRVGVAEPL
jgi:hypothetical protein